jgi:hypothetical protein
MTFVEGIGYTAAALGIAMIAMQTMIPLRITGIAHNIGQIAFGLITGTYPMVIQHVVLLPLNGFRLVQMFKLIKQVKAASGGDLSMDWLKPFMSQRSIPAGTVLFRKGDDADHMYYVLVGRLHLNEIEIDILPGSVLGELGMLVPDRKRTQTATCTENCTILEISYDRIEEIYYQNPTFGFYFLRLCSARLFQNIERLERTIQARDNEINRLKAIGPL